MKIIDCKQGTGPWLWARAGILTASEFDSLMTPLWKKRDGETPQTYILRKVAEACMGIPLSDPSAWVMEQGAILEAEAIPWLEFTHNLTVQRVGFVTSDDGRIGCSPDGLIGDDGGIEIKCPQPPAHLKYLLGGVVPKDYLAQVHGSLYVTGRGWWKFLSYSRQFPPMLLHVERNEEIIAKIDAVVQESLVDFEAKLAKVRALKAEYEGPKNAEAEKIMKADIAKMRAEAGGELPGDKWLRVSQTLRPAGSKRVGNKFSSWKNCFTN